MQPYFKVSAYIYSKKTNIQVIFIKFNFYTQRAPPKTKREPGLWETQASGQLTLVQEGEVLLDHREQGDDGRLHALAAQHVAVLGHVPRGVEHFLDVREQLLVLTGQLLPGCPETGHWGQVQAAGSRTGGATGGRERDEGYRGKKKRHREKS